MISWCMCVCVRMCVSYMWEVEHALSVLSFHCVASRDCTSGFPGKHSHLLRHLASPPASLANGFFLEDP